MKNKITIGLAFMALLFVSVSCSEDYIIGGEVNETNQLDMTTFDLLKTMEETKNVATLFERAGMKDLVNGDVTIIAPNQWSINRYLRRKHNQMLRNNPSATAPTMDDISAEELQKMGMYVLPGKFWRETIPAEGINLVAHDGTEVRLTLDRTNVDPGAAWDGSGVPGSGYQYSNFMQQVPYMVKVHFKRGQRWEMTPDERNRLTGYYDNPECDHVYRMYVSDILTRNGVVHVLYSGDYTYTDHYYYHSLFFFGLRTDDKL